jgi:O-acetylhomoserine/O-acetylserine sulfhydrylase-like pyridoxal-dependent enzyme
MTDENGNSSERESKENRETTHEQLPKREHHTCGVEEDFSRIFIKVENAKDLIFDADQVLSEVWA